MASSFPTNLANRCSNSSWMSNVPFKNREPAQPVPYLRIAAIAASLILGWLVRPKYLIAFYFTKIRINTMGFGLLRSIILRQFFLHQFHSLCWMCICYKLSALFLVTIYLENAGCKDNINIRKEIIFHLKKYLSKRIFLTDANFLSPSFLRINLSFTNRKFLYH